MGTVKYTGPVASFHCPTSAEIRSLKVHFSPKQLGEGTPSPENVREIEGWDGVEVEHTKNNLAQFEPYGTDGINLKWSVPKSILDTSSLIRYSIYIDNSNGTSEARIRVAFFDINGNRLQSRIRASGTPVGQSKRDFFTIQPIPSGTDYIVFGIKGDNFSIKEPMIDIFQNNAFKETPYEPYRGDTTNYTFGVLGKNKLPIDTTTFTRYKQYNLENPLQPGVYTVSALINSNDTDESQSLILFEKAGENDANVQVQLPRDARTSKTLTLVNSCAKVYIYAAKSYASSAGDEATWTDVQLELGSTATTYEPYNPNHTVYGGWVDLISGEVCEEYRYGGFENLNISAPTSTSTGAWAHRFNLRGNWVDNTIGWSNEVGAFDWYCDRIERVTNASNNYQGYSGSGVLYIYDDTISTVEEFRTKYADAKIVYKLREAVYEHYFLAPTQLQTFLGHNNVWSNADYVEVEYDLHETQDILARKQFIMASQPHVEEASGAIATFNTDMAAKLKECKVYFKPVQEGEGDPSPENVRTISGWTGLEVIRCGKNMLPAVADSVTKSGVIYAVEKDSNGSITRIHVTGTSTGNSSINTITNDLILPPGDYTITAMTNGDAQHDFNLRKKGTSIDIVQRVSPKTFSISETTAYQSAYVYCKSGNTFDFDVYPMIRLSSIIDDTFEPYTGTTIPITFPSEAGTIYGGYVDLVTGEVWKTADIYDLGNLSWFYNSNNDCFCASFTNISNNRIESRILACSHYKYEYANKVNSMADKTINDSQQLNLQQIQIHDNDYDRETLNDFQSAMSGIKIIYVLATPTIITTLTSLQLKTLRGINNIYSNTNDNITVKYWKH